LAEAVRLQICALDAFCSRFQVEFATRRLVSDQVCGEPNPFLLPLNIILKIALTKSKERSIRTLYTGVFPICIRNWQQLQQRIDRFFSAGLLHSRLKNP